MLKGLTFHSQKYGVLLLNVFELKIRQRKNFWNVETLLYLKGGGGSS